MMDYIDCLPVRVQLRIYPFAIKQNINELNNASFSRQRLYSSHMLITESINTYNSSPYEFTFSQ